MTRFLRDRYLWYLVALAIVLGIIIYGDYIAFPSWLPAHKEWHLTYMAVGNLVFLGGVVIAAWHFGVRGGLVVSAALGLIVVPHAVEMTVDRGMVDEALVTGIFIAVGITFSWLIGSRKQAEERKKQLQAELALSSRLASIGELAAGVAHEINNPLTGIIGLSQRLMRKSTNEKAKMDLKTIHSEGLRVAKIVENLLTFARRHESKKEYANINDILRKALDLRAYELKTSNVEVVAEFAPALPQVISDYGQIQEVFLNIILNAEQAMTEVNHRGRLSIKTQAIKNYIRVSFADDGPGISAEHLDKLFNPFFTTRGEKGGTGLGLSICHGIITEHGGRLYAKSKPGEGATFFIELPLSTEKIGESKVAEKEPAD